MITALLVIATIVAASGQFADAYTTYINVHVKKNAVETNRFAFIRWFVNKHPFINMAVTPLVGVWPAILGFGAPLFSADISTILGLQIGSLIGLGAGTFFGFQAAYHNYKVGAREA